MPRVWTSKEQALWLNSRKSDFMDHQRRKQTSRFLTLTNEEWFRKWPEFESSFPGKRRDEILTEQEKKKLAADILTRKDQIENWFFWHTKGHKTPRGSVISQYMKAIKARSKKRARAPQESETYMKFFPLKVTEAYQMRSHNASSGIEKTNLMRAIAKELLLEETPEVQERIKETVNKKREEIKAAMKDEGDGDTCESNTPEEFQRAIDEAPTFLDAAMQAFVEATGFEVCVFIGGPVPENKGSITVEQYHFGPHTPAGNDWSKTDVGYGAAVDGFAKHVFKCFPEHIRSARSLFNQNYDDKDEEDTTANKNDESVQEKSAGMQKGKETDSGDNDDDDEGGGNGEGEVEGSRNIEGEGEGSRNGENVESTNISEGGAFQGLLVMPQISQNSLTPWTTTNTYLVNEPPPFPMHVPVVPSVMRPGPESAPGGPTEPYAQAFARMTFTTHIPTITTDEQIDPVLRGPSNNAPIMAPLRMPPPTAHDINSFDYTVLPQYQHGAVPTEQGEAAMEETLEGRRPVVTEMLLGGQNPNERVKGRKRKSAGEPSETLTETIAVGRARREIRPPRRPDGELASPRSSGQKSGGRGKGRNNTKRA
ncbi:hypothetical protein CPC08DRAFT_822496 [Agrocybe pediades]|nr:hypothetical protein CPC08DRAFT_822496 [Agrocybe pediades]